MLIFCPHCRNTPPSDSLEGICPACFLLDLGVDERTDEALLFSFPGVAISEEIARGGVGIVYRGEQSNPRRPLAIKVLQPQWANNADVRVRFRREAQTIAGLDHPAILPVYGVGEDYGLPWFSMKLATGGSLAEQIAEYKGEWRSIAQLIATLADALDFAHRRGVLHRDIKPGNILFDGDGRAYLADFGLATEKARIEAQQTLQSDALGTPHYLSPEVASGKIGNATTASDVYALGAVLYELLAGRAPFQAQSLPVLLRQIVAAPPETLSAFSPVPPRDLIDICGRAMEKDPAFRYGTAKELGDDLRRFLAGKPIAARPLNWAQATWRWSRRHPAIAGLLVSVILLISALAVGSNIAAWRIQGAHANAEIHWREDLLSQAASLRRARSPGFRDQALALVRQAAAPNEGETFRVKRRSEAMCALAFPAVSELPMPQPPAPNLQFATASIGWKFLVWHDPENGNWQETRVSDGKTIASGSGGGVPQYLSADGRWLATQTRNHWKLWRVNDSEASIAFGGEGIVQDVSEDGRRVAYHVSDKGRRLAQVRENETGRIVLNIPYPDTHLALRFSPDGEFCAVAPSYYHPDAAYSVRIFRISDGVMVREIIGTLGNCVWCMSWSPDGLSLLAAERDGPVYIWDTESGNPRHILRGPATQVWRAAFSKDAQRVATVSEDGLFTVFCLVSGRPLVQGNVSLLHSRGFQWQSNDCFGPVNVDGKTTLISYQVGAYCGYKSTDTHGGVLGIAASPEGRWTVMGDARHAWLWDHRSRQARPAFAQGLWNSFCFSPDGRQLYGASESGVSRWDMTDDGPGESTVLSPPGYHHAIAIDHSGRLLAVDRAQHRSVSILQDPDSEEPKRFDLTLSLGVPTGAWLDISPDGHFVAVGGQGWFNVLSVDDRKNVYTDLRNVRGLRFSPDSRWLFVAADRFEIWSTASWKCEAILDAPPSSVMDAQAVFHPTKPILAASCRLGRIGLWSTKDWRMLGILENPSEIPVRRMSFDGTGSKLHFGSMAGIFATWDFDLLERELARQQLAW